MLTEKLRLIDAGQLSDEELRRQQWVGPMVAALKHIRDEDISPILPRLAMEINALEGDREAILGYIRTLLYYLMNAGNVETIESLADQPIPLPEPVRGEVMTIAEQLKALGRQEGLQQGRQEGLQEGLQEAVRETALKMLSEGADLEFISRVTGLSLEELANLKQSES